MRRFLLGTLTAAVLSTIPTPANAGGSWFVPDSPYLEVGTTAVARVVFSTRHHGAVPSTRDGKISDGPFYAYLLPQGVRIRPGQPVPAAAIPLGQIQITRSGTTLCCRVARLEFIVPDVPAGQYELAYCNRPCTVDAVGDLAGYFLWIAPTAEEARLRAEVDLLKGRLGYLKEYRDEARTLRASLETQIDEARELREEIDALEARLSRRAGPAEQPRPLVPGWAVLALAPAMLAAVVVFARRRRVRIPDFVPAELEEVAQVPSRQPTTSEGSPGMVSASPGRSGSRGSPVTKS